MDSIKTSIHHSTWKTALYPAMCVCFSLAYSFKDILNVKCLISYYFQSLYPMSVTLYILHFQPFDVSGSQLQGQNVNFAVEFFCLNCIVFPHSKKSILYCMLSTCLPLLIQTFMHFIHQQKEKLQRNFYSDYLLLEPAAIFHSSIISCLQIVFQIALFPFNLRDFCRWEAVVTEQ